MNKPRYKMVPAPAKDCTGCVFRGTAHQMKHCKTLPNCMPRTGNIIFIQVNKE